MSDNGKFDLQEAMAEYRRIIDEREALSEQLKSLGERKDTLERAFKSFSESTGLESFAGSGLSIRVEEKLRAKYDPEKWEELLAWAGANNGAIVQRRISDARVLEIVETGGALPPGVTLEPYTNVSYKRKNA